MAKSTKMLKKSPKKLSCKKKLERCNKRNKRLRKKIKSGEYDDYPLGLTTGFLVGRMM